MTIENEPTSHPTERPAEGRDLRSQEVLYDMLVQGKPEDLEAIRSFYQKDESGSTSTL